MKNEFISGEVQQCSQSSFTEAENGRRVGRLEAIYHQRGRLAAVIGQEAFGKANSEKKKVKKKKQNRPSLSNKLIKSYPKTNAAKNLTHSAGLSGEKFWGVWPKKKKNR